MVDGVNSRGIAGPRLTETKQRLVSLSLSSLPHFPRLILHTRTQAPVCDVVHFFYAAAQFEVGHKQGGTYYSTGCGADSSHFSDIAYCYRAPKPTLKERQELVLQGKAWKQGAE